VVTFVFWLAIFAFGFKSNARQIEVVKQSDQFQLHVDLTAKEVDDLSSSLKKTDSSIIGIDVVISFGKPRFAVTVAPKIGTENYLLVHNADGSTFDSELAKRIEQGYQISGLSSYFENKESRYSAILFKDTEAPPSRLFRRLTARELNQKTTELAESGFQPALIVADNGNDKLRFAAVYEKRTRPWLAKIDLSLSELNSIVSKLAGNGMRIVHVDAYQVNNDSRFAAIFCRVGKEFVLQSDVNPQKSDGQLLRPTDGKYRPICLTAYQSKDGFDETKTREALAEQLDVAMTQYISDRDISAATLIATRQGKLLVKKAYGSSTFSGKRRSTQVNDPFRIASISKPVTAAAINQLIARKRISVNTRVFDLLQVNGKDERWKDITVGHLLNHTAGWDNENLGYDPMFHSIEIRQTLKTSGPPTTTDIIRFMSRLKLASDPGKKYSYSNFGYCVLGRVIEKVSGQTYVDYVKTEIAKPLEMNTLDLGRSLLKNRIPGEPRYENDKRVTSVFSPNSRRQVPFPYGGFHIEAMDSHGGLVCSGPDLIKFMQKHWLDGSVRGQQKREYRFFGSLPGTFAIARQHPSGMNIVALFNKRSGDFDKDKQISDLIDDAIKKSVATRYMVVWKKD